MPRSLIHSLKHVLLVAALMLAWAPAGHGQSMSYSGSLQYTTGEYIFAERTTSLYLFNGLSLSAGRLQAGVTMPLIAQSSPWVSSTGIGMVPSGGPQHDRVGEQRNGQGGEPVQRHRRIHLPDTASYRQIGLGDPVARLEATLVDECDRLPCVRLTGSIKAPIADVDRGFGTGAWDAGAGLSLSRQFDEWFVFADATYWYLGDLPELELRDALAYGFSIGRAFRRGRIGVLASLTGYTRIIDDVDPPLQLGLGASLGFPPGRSVSASLGIGLSESAPALSLGLGWRIGL